MEFFNCDPQWPICLYDFSFDNKLPTYFCFRPMQNLDTFVVEDYFYSGLPEPLSGPTTFSNPNQVLLIERNQHMCCNPDYPQFVPHFHKRFLAWDKSLHQNATLNFFFENDLELERVTTAFVN